MTSQNQVRLLVSGVDYAGWLEVSISAGIERVCRDFSLSVTRSWPGAVDIPRQIRPGDLCEVFIGTDRVLTGYVDATPINYDGTQVTVGVNGRSKTADLVDCSAIGTAQWKSSSINQIAADLAGQYGIAVIANVSTGGSVPEHQIEPGETVFDSIDRLLKSRQLWASDDEFGRLVILKVGADRATDSLEIGKNVLAGSAGLDFKDRYSDYQVKGQHAGDDDFYGEKTAGASGSTTDTGVGRKRVLIVQQSGQATSSACLERAKFEAAYRAGKSLAASYTVQGWRQSDGRLWRHNQLVRIIDPIIGFDEVMVISEVDYKLSDQGMTAVLQVAPPGAFARNDDVETAEKADKAKSGKAAAKGSSYGGWGDVTPIGKSVKNKVDGKAGGKWSSVQPDEDD